MSASLLFVLEYRLLKKELNLNDGAKKMREMMSESLGAKK
jgi:hypothetical protein